MKTFLMMLILILCIVPVGAVDWHDDSRLNRIQLNVNDSSVALTDYQLMKIIAYDSDMQADFDDLLFYNESGANVSYWIESKTDSNTADVWLKIPSISITTGAKVWMYYNNSAASSASSGVDVFELFDDFNDNSFDTSKWTKAGNAGSVTEALGVLRLDYYSNYNPHVHSVDTFGTNVILEWTSRSPVASYLMGFTDHHIAGDNPLNFDNGLTIQPHTASDIQLSNTLTGNRTNVEITPVVDADYHDYKIIRNGTTNAKYYYDGAEETIISTNLPTGDLNIYFNTAAGANSDIDVNIAKIRKYTATEPTWGTDGAEESYEAPPSSTLNGIYLYPNSTYSIGYYGSLTSELVYETGINFSDLYTFNLLSAENMEYLSIDDTNYIPSIDKDAAHDGYLYGNFSLHDVGSVNFITVKTVHNRVHANPVILGLFNTSTQKWHAVNNSSVETVDIELTYNITGTDITKYSTLIDNTLNLSVSLNTNGDGNYNVFVDFVEVYIDYEEVARPSLEYVYNLVVLNQNNISILQKDVDDLENNVNNLYMFILLCTVFLVGTLRKRGDQ